MNIILLKRLTQFSENFKTHALRTDGNCILFRQRRNHNLLLIVTTEIFRSTFLHHSYISLYYR